jgi:hypothetical protein
MTSWSTGSASTPRRSSRHRPRSRTCTSTTSISAHWRANGHWQSSSYPGRSLRFWARWRPPALDRRRATTLAKCSRPRADGEWRWGGCAPTAPAVFDGTAGARGDSPQPRRALTDIKNQPRDGRHGRSHPRPSRPCTAERSIAGPPDAPFGCRTATRLRRDALRARSAAAGAIRGDLSSVQSEPVPCRAGTHQDSRSAGLQQTSRADHLRRQDHGGGEDDSDAAVALRGAEGLESCIG